MRYFLLLLSLFHFSPSYADIFYKSKKLEANKFYRLGDLALRWRNMYLGAMKEKEASKRFEVYMHGLGTDVRLTYTCFTGRGGLTRYFSLVNGAFRPFKGEGTMMFTYNFDSEGKTTFFLASGYRYEHVADRIYDLEFIDKLLKHKKVEIRVYAEVYDEKTKSIVKPYDKSGVFNLSGLNEAKQWADKNCHAAVRPPK